MDSDQVLQLIESHLITPLNDNERDLFRGIWEHKSYQEIHRDYFGDRCRVRHLSSNIAGGLWRKLRPLLGEDVSKGTLHGAVARAQLSLRPLGSGELDSGELDSGELDSGDLDSGELDSGELDSGFISIFETQTQLRHRDWGISPDVAEFCGREAVLQQFEQRLRVEGCQLLSICGEAGVGKTWLAKQLALKLADQYGAVVWRSLRARPPLPLNALLSDLMGGLSQREVHGPIGITDFVNFLMDCPSLVVLDQFETMLQGNVHDGRYLANYQAYGELLTQLGQRRHQSCILLVSREKPREVAGVAAGHLVCNLDLLGLEVLEAEELLNLPRQPAPSAGWGQLTQRYGGNPAALRSAVSLIQELYMGNVELFLAEYQQLPEEVRDSQRDQFDRLSALEQSLLVQLSQQPSALLTPAILKTIELAEPLVERQEAQRSLLRRSLLRSCPSQQPGAYRITALMGHYIRQDIICQDILGRPS